MIQPFATNLRNLPKAMALLGAALAAGPAAAVSQQKAPPRLPFAGDISAVRTSLTLPLKAERVTVNLPLFRIKQRVKKARKDDTVEPLTVILRDKETQYATIAEKIGRYGHKDQLVSYLKKQWKKAEPIVPGGEARRVTIGEKGFAHVSARGFSELYSRPHHKLTVDGSNIRQDVRTIRKLTSQLRRFLPRKEIGRIFRRLRRGKDLPVGKKLLPDFARKMVGRFIIHRGPNCFHAALAFHGPVMTRSSLINVKKEDGYHRAMINYDELWRAISRNFYEIDPRKTPLRYGDMLVYFDVPKGKMDGRDPVDYKWIRHTSTYLFNGYTWAKGSKSPNTPYTVRTLGEEWNNWKKYTDNLGLKVFRRSRDDLSRKLPKDLTNWLY